jgi:hypothetical protein
MENLDNKLNISAGFIIAGQLGDVKRLRQVILDFLGAELAPDGYVHQATPSTSVRLIYHTLSKDHLFLTKERPWRISKEVK